MTICILALMENVLYWFIILPIFVMFFVGLVYTVEKEYKLGKYSSGISAVTQIFWLVILLSIVRYDKTEALFSDLTNNPVPVTIALFASFLVSLITLAVLSICQENKKNKKGSEDN